MIEKSDLRQEQPTMEEVQEATPVEIPEGVQEPSPVETPEAESPQGEGLSNRQIAGMVLVGLVVLVVISLMLYGLVTHPILTSILRDISIIALALVTLIIGLFLIVLIFQLQSLITLLRDEVKPILESANETASTVRGTTTFVSDAVVTPMIHIVSLFAGVGQTFRTLRRTGHKRTRPKPPPES
jgi:amino acid transporter